MNTQDNEDQLPLEQRMKLWFIKLKTWQKVLVVLGVASILMFTYVLIAIPETEEPKQSTVTEKDMRNARLYLMRVQLGEEGCNAVLEYYNDLRLSYEFPETINIITREVNVLGGDLTEEDVEIALTACTVTSIEGYDLEW